MSLTSGRQLLLSSAAAGSTQYQVSRSLRFNSPDSAHLSRTPASAGTSRTTWTLSFWVKRSTFSTAQWLFFSSDLTANTTAAYFTASDTLEFYEFQSGSYVARLITTQVFRDPSAWYHFVFTWDTNNGTSGDRLRIYVNNQRIDAFSTSTYPSSGTQSRWNNNVLHYLSRGVGSEYFAGYLANVEFVDGTALTPSSFAETDATTGQWIPRQYGGSYGTNGFKLTFADNSAATAAALGKDTSGNSNNWTPNNLSVTAGAGNDSLVDTPTSYGTDTGAGGEVRGNYATLNPLDNGGTILSNGNLDVTKAGAGFLSVRGTIGMSSGKWYWEYTRASGSGNNLVVGLAGASANITTYFDISANGYGYRANDGNKTNNNTASSYGASYAAGDVVGIAFDADAGSLTFYKNGTSQGTAFTSLTSGPYFPAVAIAGGDTGSLNFGQRAFAYTAPSGFKALVDTNLPAVDPAVAKPSTVMDVKLYTGNGSTQTISGLGFSPDFVWSKCRNVSRSHRLSDAVRGSNRDIYSDTTAAESADGSITAFTSNGFNLDNSTGSQYNVNGETYVSWCWDAGTSTVTNTQGSITSSVRANASAGFSIVTYTGTGANATIGHGGLANLSNGMIIIKNRSSATNWRVYHSALGNTKVIFLSTTGTPDTNSVYWNNTSPTSTVFSVGSDDGVNGNGNAMVAYCFAPVAGYSSFGSYTGNGSSDGPFVFCNFRPRYLMVKASSAGGSYYYWYVFDSVRDTANPTDLMLFPNVSDAESSGYDFDLLANGFKVRTNAIYVNNSAVTYIYAAFAESPFQYARAR